MDGGTGFQSSCSIHDTICPPPSAPVTTTTSAAIRITISCLDGWTRSERRRSRGRCPIDQRHPKWRSSIWGGDAECRDRADAVCRPGRDTGSGQAPATKDVPYQWVLRRLFLTRLTAATPSSIPAAGLNWSGWRPMCARARRHPPTSDRAMKDFPVYRCGLMAN